MVPNKSGVVQGISTSNYLFTGATAGFISAAIGCGFVSCGALIVSGGTQQFLYFPLIEIAMGYGVIFLIGAILGGPVGLLTGALLGLVDGLFEWNLPKHSVWLWIAISITFGSIGGGLVVGTILSLMPEIESNSFIDPHAIYVGAFFGAISGIFAGPIFKLLYGQWSKTSLIVRNNI